MEAWIREEKRRLRAERMARVRAMSPAERARESGRILERVLALPGYREARVIMAFCSLPTEPDTRGILADAAAQGKTVLLPRCLEAPRMEALPYRGEALLRPGPWGIPEPVPEAEKNSAGPEPELILVPCVAATPAVARLGHGAGYYDWFLRDRRAEKVCLCFSVQLTETLPTEETDIRMDRVITGG